jgi:hypothetical protein
LGQHASSNLFLTLGVIEIVSLMMRLKRPLKDLSNSYCAYPSITEGLQECYRLLMGNINLLNKRNFNS